MSKQFDNSIHEELEKLLLQIAPMLGLEQWIITLEVGRLEDARACCSAEPEYKTATIVFDPDKLKTGDDLQEVALHEHSHCLTWPLHILAEQQAKALSQLLPEPQRDVVSAMLAEQVRNAAEMVTTDVGFAFLRLFRRVWQLEAEVKSLKAKLKQQKGDSDV